MESGVSGVESGVKGGGSGGNGGVDGGKGGSARAQGDGARKDGGGRNSQVSSRVSFCDKVIGGTGCSKPALKDALDEGELAMMTFLNGDRTCPMVHFTDQAIDILAALWREALVIKLFGKHCSYTAMREKLRGVWKLWGGIRSHGCWLWLFPSEI